MILELIIGCWILEPFAREIDEINYEKELLQDEIEELREEIETLKYSGKYYKI